MLNVEGSPWSFYCWWLTFQLSPSMMPITNNCKAWQKQQSATEFDIDLHPYHRNQGQVNVPFTFSLLVLPFFLLSKKAFNFQPSRGILVRLDATGKPVIDGNSDLSGRGWRYWFIGEEGVPQRCPYNGRGGMKFMWILNALMFDEVSINASALLGRDITWYNCYTISLHYCSRSSANVHTCVFFLVPWITISS